MKGNLTFPRKARKAERDLCVESEYEIWIEGRWIDREMERGRCIDREMDRGAFPVLSLSERTFSVMNL